MPLSFNRLSPKTQPNLINERTNIKEGFHLNLYKEHSYEPENQIEISNQIASS
jgi:hypothetical protein